MKYKRILLKLSGEALMGARQYGIDPARLKEYATEIKEVVKQGVEVAIVIGGGNIFRGVAGASNGMDRVQGDYMGMLACWYSESNHPAMKRALRFTTPNAACWRTIFTPKWRCTPNTAALFPNLPAATTSAASCR